MALFWTPTPPLTSASQVSKMLLIAVPQVFLFLYFLRVLSHLKCSDIHHCVELKKCNDIFFFRIVHCGSRLNNNTHNRCQLWHCLWLFLFSLQFCVKKASTESFWSLISCCYFFRRMALVVFLGGQQQHFQDLCWAHPYTDTVQRLSAWSGHRLLL